jgi:diguanylate cyclase (GGDEF)-like protein
LDFFKKFNDKYGHGAGDVVLRNFAQILMGSIRKGDILLRYGGEEFCLFLFGGQVDNSHEVFEIIDKRLTDLEMEYQGNKLNKINFSAGATIVPWERMKEIADSPEDQLPLIIANVCQPADQALYQAKKQGRGQLVVASE